MKMSTDLIKYFNSLLAFVCTLVFLILVLPISKEYSNKNQCVKSAKQELVDNLPEAYVEASNIKRDQIAIMIAYQLCTHRNDN